MFCEQCGMKLAEGTLFCPNCGAKVPSGEVGYEDDDKTVILHEEQPGAAEMADTVQTEDEAAEAVEAAKTAEPTEPAEAVKTTESAEPVETEEPAGPVEAAGEAKPVEPAEAPDTGAEKVEAVEISPTGVVGTGTAVAVPAAAAQKKFCPNCGAANGINDLFCQQCGMFFGNAGGRTGDGPAPGKTNKGKKALKIVAAAVAAAAVIGLGTLVVPRILGGFTSKDSGLDFVMYLKDNELTMARKNKYEPLVVGDRMFDDGDDSASVNSYIEDFVQYSEDHQYVYYPQKIDDDGCDLYRKKLGSKKEDEIKIDSGIVEYEVIDNDRILYIKDSTDRKLYLYQKDESEKIASGVWDLHVSADKKHFMWRDEDDRLYVQDTALKSDKVKLESDVTSIYEVSENFNTIVYQKEDKLYVMKGMEDKEKIASDVYAAYVYDINGSLKIYYLREGEEANLSYYDFVEDDCLVQDQQMAEPRIEDYQKVTYKDSFWGMQESVEVSDSYYEELDKYLDKLLRDRLRISLENDVPALEEFDVYYYEDAEGESSKILTTLQQQENAVWGSAAMDSALMYVYNIDQEKVDKPKLSDLNYTVAALSGGVTSMDEVRMLSEMGDAAAAEQDIMWQIESGRQLLYLENGEVHEIEDSSLTASLYMWANEDRQILYVSDFDGENNRLYSYSYGQNDASLELITDELMHVVSFDMDDICYINTDDEMYYGDTMIAEDCAGLSKVCEDDALLYLTDMDKSGEEGTLHLYRNGKDVEIADDVAPIGGYGMFDTDKVVFLTDYNFKKYRGDLNVYDGKDVKTVDTDVTRIICK